MTERPTNITLAGARDWAVKMFADCGIADARRDANVLLCHAAGIDTAKLIADGDRELPNAALDKFCATVMRRTAREPISRILGRRAFWDIELQVTADVLDPRPDTETLIEAAIQRFADHQNDPLRILDLGAGSGALICALLRAFPNATGLAIDISSGACRIARRNADAYGLAARIEIRCGNWQTVLPEMSNEKSDNKFDLVVSNPPYVKNGDIAALDLEVRLWDPAIALDGGDDGLRAYRQLAEIIPARLAADAWTILEIGAGQATCVSAIMRQAGYQTIHQHADLSDQPRALAMQT